MFSHRPGAHRRQGSVRAAPRRARRRAHPDGDAAARSTLELTPLIRDGGRRAARSPDERRDALVAAGARLHARAPRQPHARARLHRATRSPRCWRSTAPSPSPTAWTSLPRKLEAVRAFAQAARRRRASPRRTSASPTSSSRRTRRARSSASSTHDNFARAGWSATCYHALRKRVARRPSPQFEKGDYTGYLKSFAVLRAPVDAFFDGVMVMVEDPARAPEAPEPALRAGVRDEPRRRHLEARS